jgi:DNA-directed RNA polymerase subunit M/transcription elongation factor TFIIS
MAKEPWLKTRVAAVRQRALGLRAAAARQRASDLHERSARLRTESDDLLNTAEQARTGATALPHCPVCAHDETKPALRTELVQYYRCPRCGFVWSRPHADADFAPKTA